MPADRIEAPYYPVIYVRGYAGSQAAVEDTAADPYMGFNLGATKSRQLWTGEIQRHYFESPLIRLMKEYGYRDVYLGGREMPLGTEPSPRSVFIYRYYDQVSRELGPGVRGEIEDYALGLGRLILRVRDRICETTGDPPESFRVYLVAHSMGGLIVRSLLQNDALGADTDRAAMGEARALVDKVFTYATPHNGIDLQVVGNVPGFFSRNNADNFNRGRMREYLGFDPADEEAPVNSLDGRFDPDRFFCLVGTNHSDYAVAHGWSRRMVGPMSDGLVRIVNAAVFGPERGGGRHQAPRAFVHRSHSGHFGIVNSEDGYQNLIRFLFGDVRVDGVLEIKGITLPPKIKKMYKEGRRVRASYHFDTTVRVRGATSWELHRRDVEHGSSIFRRFDELLPRDPATARPRHPHLFSVFLSAAKRVNARRASLGFSISLSVHVPQYEIDRELWFDDHHEGGFLFRDKVNLEAVPPDADSDDWRVKYGFDSRTPNRATTYVDPIPGNDGALSFRIPIRQRTDPGLDAHLVLRATPWNRP